MEKFHGAMFLNDRQEIGKAMNFGKYPVLWMEVGKPMNGWEDFQAYEGCKAKIVSHTTSHGDLIYAGTLRMYEDEQNTAEQTEEDKFTPWRWTNIHLSHGGTFLSADFGYNDVIEDLEAAQAVMIEPNQEVIVVFKDSVNKRCWVRKMVTTSHVNPHCSTMLMLVNPKEVS